MKMILISVVALVLLLLAVAAGIHFSQPRPGKSYVVDCRDDRSQPLPGGAVAEKKLPCKILK